MANRLQYARDFNPYAKGVTMEELVKVRRQLAKVINQRMVRLENTKSPISGESYMFGAYDIMSDYLQERDRNRFSEVLNPKGMTKQDIQKEIRVLQGFEEMKSSRIQGMHQIEAARIKTFTSANAGSTKALHEEVVKTKDFYDFLNSTTFKEITEKIDSDKLVEEYDRAAARGVSKADIVKALNDYSKRAKRISIKGMKRKLRALAVSTLEEENPFE